MYQSSHMEDYIKQVYSYLKISTPYQINKFSIADKLDIGLYPVDGNSEAIFSDGRQYIFIDRNLEPQERWQDFGHELCHVLWHTGDQNHMPPPFREYQEWKANLFALHFCIPTFMIQDLALSNHPQKAIWQVQETFNVTYEFAEKRLEIFYQKILIGVML